MNIYDVSEHAGVSIATVSRVLNGNPNVSEKTREKVLKVMDELGYTPNVFVEAWGLNTMKTIGIMCSDSSDPYLAGAIYYLERGLRAHGYDAILCCTGYDLDAKTEVFLICFVPNGWMPSYWPVPSSWRCVPRIMPISSRLLPTFPSCWSTASWKARIYTALSATITRRCMALPASCSPPDAGASCMYTPAIPTAGSISWKDTRTPSNQRASRHPTNSSRQCPKDIEAARELMLSLHREGLEFDAVITSDDSLAVGL